MKHDIIIVADAHLSSAPPAAARNARFFNFIKTMPSECRFFFILGDLFDEWLGDDDDAELAVKTKEALSALTARGVMTFIQPGNHDFLLGARFMQATGCNLLPEPYLLETRQARYLLMHGDTVVDDPAYLRFRRFIRSPVVVGVWNLLPLRQRRRLAKKLRSRVERQAQKMIPDRARMLSLLQRYDCPTLIHGHIHHAEEESLSEDKKRICLPDWMSAPGYLAIEDERYEIVPLAAADGELAD